MCFTVIIGRIVSADNRNGNIDRIDFLVTICHIERDSFKVRICVLKLAGSQLHIRSAGVDPLCFCFSDECKVCFCIQLVVNLNIIAADSVFFPIIVDSIVVTGNCYCNIDRADCLITVSNNKGDFSKITVVVFELISCQAHGCSTRIGPRSRRCTVESKVSFLVQFIADHHVITADAVLFAVIICNIVMPGNGHNHFFNGCNRLISVRNDKRDRTEVGIGISELICRQAHVRGALIHPGR